RGGRTVVRVRRTDGPALGCAGVNGRVAEARRWVGAVEGWCERRGPVEWNNTGRLAGGRGWVRARAPAVRGGWILGGGWGGWVEDRWIGSTRCAWRGVEAG